VVAEIIAWRTLRQKTVAVSSIQSSPRRVTSSGIRLVRAADLPSTLAVALPAA